MVVVRYAPRMDVAVKDIQGSDLVLNGGRDDFDPGGALPDAVKQVAYPMNGRWLGFQALSKHDVGEDQNNEALRCAMGLAA